MVSRFGGLLSRKRARVAGWTLSHQQKSGLSGRLSFRIDSILIFGIVRATGLDVIGLSFRSRRLGTHPIGLFPLEPDDSDLGEAFFKLRRPQLRSHALHHVFRNVALAPPVALDTHF